MPYTIKPNGLRFAVVNDNGDLCGDYPTEPAARAASDALNGRDLVKFDDTATGQPKTMFIPIAKVDARKRQVWGYAATEVPDNADEIMDYNSSKPNWEKWSQAAHARSGGKSLGNLRAMHKNIAAGKLIEFKPDDLNKGIWVGAEVVDDAEWKKVEAGVYTGFSVGGNYARRWMDNRLGKMRYTADPSELSLVDAPCIPTATFEMIKEDGTQELRKFSQGTDLLKAMPDSPAAVGSVDVPGDDEVERIPDPTRPMQVNPANPPDGETLAARQLGVTGMTAEMTELMGTSLTETVSKLRKMADALETLQKGSWEESKHPRADDGKFGSGGGSSGGKAESGGGEKPASGGDKAPASAPKAEETRTPWMMTSGKKLPENEAKAITGKPFDSMTGDDHNKLTAHYAAAFNEPGADKATVGHLATVHERMGLASEKGISPTDVMPQEHIDFARNHYSASAPSTAPDAGSGKPDAASDPQAEAAKEPAADKRWDKPNSSGDVNGFGEHGNAARVYTAPDGSHKVVKYSDDTIVGTTAHPSREAAIHEANKHLASHSPKHQETADLSAASGHNWSSFMGSTALEGENTATGKKAKVDKDTRTGKYHVMQHEAGEYQGTTAHKSREEAIAAANKFMASEPKAKKATAPGHLIKVNNRQPRLVKVSRRPRLIKVSR